MQARKFHFVTLTFVRNILKTPTFVAFSHKKPGHNLK
jgi:hypothetical protein